MKTQNFLAGAVLLSVADCLPQILITNRSTAKASIITGGGVTLGDPFTLPAGFTLPPGVTLPPGITIGTELTRSGNLPGFTFGTPPGTVKPPAPTSTRKSSSSVKTTSSTSKTTSTTKPLPPTTSSTSSTIKTTSSSRLIPTTKTTSSSTKSSRSTTTPPPPTTSSTTSSRSMPPTPTTKRTSSSTKSTRSTTPVPPPTTSKSTISTTKSTSTSKSTTPPITQPPTTSKTTSSSTKTTSPPVTTSKPPSSTNPYSATCPIPSSYVINNFISYDGPDGDVALTISYGSGVFTCPNTFEHSTLSNGKFTLDCDDDGLVKVVTDGKTFVYVVQKFWCDEVPKPPGSYATLQSSANYTFPADALFCETDDINIRTCLQLDPDITIPVQSYSAGGTISFTPLDTNGAPVPECPTIVSTQPIVQDPATCGVGSVSETATGATQTGTGKPTASVRFTQSATVTINGR